MNTLENIQKCTFIPQLYHVYDIIFAAFHIYEKDWRIWHYCK